MAGRPIKTDIYPGKMFGKLRIIQKVRTKPNAPGGQKYLVECQCPQRTRETVPRFYLMRKNNPKRHCGCERVQADEPYTKRSWYMMHQRCYYEKHVAYKDYGGRGIKVDWAWHKDNPNGWENFKRDMGVRPFGKTLDRIDPNSNYGPQGPDGKPLCRWATPKEQNNNQRRHQVATPIPPEPVTPEDIEVEDPNG